MKNKRNFDDEILDTDSHKYAYNFDFDVMHHYMIKSFSPFFKKGSALELGCFRGDFTIRLKKYFEDITCVDASNDALDFAKKRLGKNATFIMGEFEEVKLNRSYKNIFCTHVLEHISEPIELLKKINNEWLDPEGRLFLACPNANAPSRQIAVKMGLMDSNNSITESEKSHGHQITYTLDVLERQAELAGLNVEFRSGIFFKALANFQWDRLLNTDIISDQYLEGCYKLGQVYPELCSSIFLICNKR